MLKYESPIELPRKLGKHAFIVFAILQAASLAKTGPVTAEFIKDYCPEFGINTVTAALRKLTSPEIQMAVRVTGGWILNNENAFQLPLGYAGLPKQSQITQSHSQSENHSQRDFAPEQAEIIDVLPQGSENFEAENHSQSENHSQRDFAESLDRESFNLKDIDLNTEDLNKKLDSLDSKTSPEILCKNAYLLLHKPVYCNDEIRARSIIEILGWLAHAYDNFDAFTSPAGWVYNGLLRKLKVKGKPRPDLRPDPQYEKDPFAFLPFAYLEAVGLAEYYVQRRCESCKEPGGNHLPWCKNGAGKYTEVEEIIRESVDDAELAADKAPTVLDDPVIVQHWQKVLSRLRIELPRAQFDTWLRDTVPMDWEHQAGILNIGAGSNYARGWLETRVADTIVKMLADEMGRQVTVRFVVLGGGQ